jgi:hypothetical protein
MALSIARLLAEGMTDAAMPNLALLLHQMSVSAAMWRPDRPAERPRVVTHRADNVLHLDFESPAPRLETSCANTRVPRLVDD